MEELEKLKKRFGWDVMDDTVAVATERTVDPRILNVTITFKVIKNEP